MTSVPTPSDLSERNHQYREARVWDLPTRAFHWLLVVSVVAGWLLGENLSFSNIQWHFYFGYMTGGLLLFRLIWGVFGPKPVTFRALIFSPTEIFSYLRRIGKRKPSGIAGHNPLGALSVIALLGTLMVQVMTGLFAASDDLFSSGPLSGLIDSSLVGIVNSIHEINSKILLALVITHIAAIVFYWLWKHENLVRPMITGRKLVKPVERETN